MHSVSYWRAPAGSAWSYPHGAWPPGGSAAGQYWGGRGFGGLGELLDTEWRGKLELSPLQLRYHHRFVARLMSYFLDPWEAWLESGMDFVSMLDSMLLMMDSRLMGSGVHTSLP